MHRDEPEKKSPKPRRPERRGSGPLGPARTPSDRPVQIAGEVRRAIQSELSRGLNDPRVPASESEQLVAKLRANRSEVWYLAAKDEGHGFRKKGNRDFYLKTAATFLERLRD